MIGYLQIINCRMGGLTPTDAFVYIRPAPPGDHENQIKDGGDFIDVWTDGSSPARADLRWATDITIHLMPGLDTTIEHYIKWWLAFIAVEPAHLIGIDTDGELNTWQAHSEQMESTFKNTMRRLNLVEASLRNQPTRMM